MYTGKESFIQALQNKYDCSTLCLILISFFEESTRVVLKHPQIFSTKKKSCWLRGRHKRCSPKRKLLKAFPNKQPSGSRHKHKTRQEIIDATDGSDHTQKSWAWKCFFQIRIEQLHSQYSSGYSVTCLLQLLKFTYQISTTFWMQ